MRISDWSSDVCSSDLIFFPRPFGIGVVKTKQKAPAILSRPHPVMKRRADIADMQIAGGGGSETSGAGQILSPHCLPQYAASPRSGVLRDKQICSLTTKSGERCVGKGVERKCRFQG